LGIAVLLALSALGGLWSPLRWALPVLALAFGVSVLQAGRTAARASATRRTAPRSYRVRFVALVTFLQVLQPVLRATGATVLPGGPFDRWDLQVLDGTLGSVRLRLAVEEHGAGRQFLKLRAWPRCSGAALALTLLFLVLGGGAALDGVWAASALLVGVALHLALRAFRECAGAAGAVWWAVSRLAPRPGAAGGDIGASPEQREP
jgi:hypothetical protein